MQRCRSWLGRPINGTSLAALRICFGGVMVYQAYEFVKPTGGSIPLKVLYTGENVHWNFGLPYFEWVRPLPEPGMTIAVALTAIASAFLAIGLLSRLSALLVGVLFTYLWMIETSWWNNHYYLSSLFCLLLALSPCDRCLSVDQWLRGRRGHASGQWDALIPFWPVFVFRAQMFIVYTYAAVVKMNQDWFMGEPVRLWFRNRLAARPLANLLSPAAMEPFYNFLASEPVVYLFVVGGLVFDLSIGLLLCIRRTQVLALVLTFLFHGTNFCIFNIGAFPFMGFTATLIFLDPDWPLRVRNWLNSPSLSPPDPAWMLFGMVAIPIVGAVLGWKTHPSPAPPARSTPFPVSAILMALLGAFLAAQVLLPLRHLVIDGDVHWTGEGSKFAWQVMARAHVGHIRYRIQDPAWPTPDKRPYPSVQWPAVDGQPPSVVYRDIDAARIDPRQFPEIIVVLEPFVGERVFYNPSTYPSDNIDKVRQRVDGIWLATYGRTPNILPTRPLTEILAEEIRRPITPGSIVPTSLADDYRSLGRTLVDQDALIRARGPGHPSTLEDVLAFQANLGRFLALAAKLNRPEVLVQNYQCRPFDVFVGGGPSGFVILDPKLQQRGGGFFFTSVLWDQWRGDKTVYTDFSRMPSDMMYFLPLRVFGYDKKGQPVVLWNAERDLVSLQLQGHAPWGVMIHQYANQRIARFWKDKTGVWPRVFAESYAKLNQNPLQPLVDPEVDLAAVPLRIWSHNSWILPMRFRNVIYHDRGKPRMKLVPQP